MAKKTYKLKDISAPYYYDYRGHTITKVTTNDDYWYCIDDEWNDFFQTTDEACAEIDKIEEDN